ncbi:MAG: bifunctional riboflavin kinase/FAD synthetase [Bacteroidales bacterium]|nr:bifunctional riboflavin kinase/FAD synthetase [Bacteroidales bacterium]
MRIHTDFTHIEEIINPVATIGAFDGVHLGHKKIISHVIDAAKKIRGESVVITFSPHPRIVLNPKDTSFKTINTHLDKIDRFYYTGIDHLIVIPFNREYAALSSEEFVRDLLVKKLKITKLIVGYDLHIGSDRMGGIDAFRKLGRKYGFEVEEISALDIQNATVSSTAIRNALTTGNITEANALLGYDYFVYGRVVYGNQIGKQLGFPTANIQIKDAHKMLPCNGVYVVTVDWNGQHYGGMCNVGIRPTISHSKLTVEVHIFNFDRNIYLDYLSVSFIDRIRDERRFDDLRSLRFQLEKDQKYAIDLLKTYDSKLANF